MGVISAYQASFSDFSTENSLRFDCNYTKANKLTSKNFYSFKELFDVVESSKIDIENLDEFQYAEIGDVSKNGSVTSVTLSFDKRDEENESLFVKIEKGDIIFPEKGDILISKIRPYLNKNVFIEQQDTYFTKAFIQIRPKINSQIFYFALRTIFSEQLIAASRQGKGYPTLKEDDVRAIRFPSVIIEKLRSQEKTLTKEIYRLKSEISALRVKVIKTEEVINRIFGNELGFNWTKFKELKARKCFTSTLSNFSGNIDYRFSNKFHNEAGQYLYDFLCSKTNKRIKDFIAEPIVLGKSVSPKDYNEDGDYYYIAMSNIKNWEFESEDCKTVTNEYAIANQNKTVKKGDILLARSGEGTIGKVALIKSDDINGIFADFTQRIRLENYNLQLAYYYFRSDFFQYLVYTHKKGLGNNTNIFPSQIREFPIPNWDLKLQNDVMNKIKTQLDNRNKIDKVIEDKEMEINLLIKNAVI